MDVYEKKYMIPSNDVNGMELIHTISTVKDNIMGYTQRKFECSKEERRIYHIIRNPTTDNSKHLLR